ncbi:hypothetical protein MUP32_06710 [Candidatus Microgenomates bacterium]|nr:hypothetical protein [Candidatus Microgenomates bacterium]
MRFIFYSFLIYLFILPAPAYAYLDPGSGSYVLQMAFGLFIGLSFLFRSSLKRLIVFIKNTIFRKDEGLRKDKAD